MPKKKEVPLEISEQPTEATVAETQKVEQKLTEAQLNKAVRVQNVGAPFVYDLTGYGYGGRWPTKAVYVLPVRVYLDLLQHGFNGSYV